MARDLTDRQRRYARARADGATARQAAALSGYSMASANALNVATWRLERHPAVAREVERLRGDQRLQHLCAVPLALKVVIEALQAEGYHGEAARCARPCPSMQEGT
jgi:phage terminase small subunit